MGEETDRHLTWPLRCTACFNLVPRVLSPPLSYGFFRENWIFFEVHELHAPQSFKIVTNKAC